MTLDQLRGLNEIRIMMVCMGNICRSPAAEVVLKAKLAAAGLSHVVVDSSGTGGWHEGEGANPKSIVTWEKRGYRGSHKARQFRAPWFHERDLILVMDDENFHTLIARAPDEESKARVRYLREFDALATEREVPDPYYGGMDGFEYMLDLIESACDGLVAELQAL